jgi:hypothetical protein
VRERGKEKKDTKKEGESFSSDSVAALILPLTFWDVRYTQISIGLNHALILDETGTLSQASSFLSIVACLPFVSLSFFSSSFFAYFPSASVCTCDSFASLTLLFLSSVGRVIALGTNSSGQLGPISSGKPLGIFASVPLPLSTYVLSLFHQSVSDSSLLFYK